MTVSPQLVECVTAVWLIVHCLSFAFVPQPSFHSFQDSRSVVRALKPGQTEKGRLTAMLQRFEAERL